jgi:autotransporter-associated beta strand protein
LAITNGFGSQVTLSGTGNTFEGPLLISGAGTGGQAYRFSVASLADSTTANGRIVFSVSSVSHGNGSVFVYTGSSDLTLNNRVIEIASTGATPVNGHQIRRDGSGTITINTDLLVNSTTAQTLSLGGTNTTGVNTFDGAISNGASSAISLTKVDAGTWVLSGTNIYTGNTTISAGILEVGGSGSLGAGNYAGTISIANVSGGTLRVNSTASQILGGVISGAGALVKGNSGVLTLTNANLYTGATTVNAGTLLVNGSTAVGSAFTVGGALASGTPTLGGTGTIGGTVNIAEASGGVAGTLSPGASIESLASGALTMGTGSTFVFESLNNASTGADLMVVNGGLSLTSVNLDLTGANLADPGWAVNDKLTLISYTGSTITSGFVGFANNSLHTFGLNEWRFLYDDSTPGSNYFSEATGSQFVTMELITVVPEPSSLAMLAFGLISLWLFRKRQ